MNMKIRPLHDRVVVKRIKPTTKGGIIIPDNVGEKPSQGEVISVGPGKLLDNGQRAPLSVKAGDKVLFGKYAGSEFTIDDEECVVVKEEDIVGVLA